MPQFASRPRNWLVGLLWAPNIGKMKREKDTDALMRALEHPKSRVRWTVMRALGELWDIPALVDLGHSDPDIRAQAAETLGKLGDKRAIAPLIASLWDPVVVYYAEVRYFFPVRINAIEALGKIGDPMTIDPLVEAFRRQSWGYPTRGNEPLYTCLISLGEPMFVRLITLLEDDDQHMRDFAIRALGYFGDPQAIEPLGNALKREKYHFLKRAALQALRRIGSEQTIPVLITALQQEEDPMAQLDIVRFLGRMRDERIAPVLIDALRKVDPSTRKMMINSIVRSGNPEALAAVEEYQQRESS
jgi:HEAT repeat protein